MHIVNIAEDLHGYNADYQHSPEFQNIKIYTSNISSDLQSNKLFSFSTIGKIHGHFSYQPAFESTELGINQFSLNKTDNKTVNEA